MPKLDDMVRSLRKAKDEGTIKLTGWENVFVEDMFECISQYTSVRQAEKIEEIFVKYCRTGAPNWKTRLGTLWAAKWRILIPIVCLVIGGVVSDMRSSTPPPPVEDAELQECSRQYALLDEWCRSVEWTLRVHEIPVVFPGPLSADKQALQAYEIEKILRIKPNR